MEPAAASTADERAQFLADKVVGAVLVFFSLLMFLGAGVITAFLSSLMPHSQPVMPFPQFSSTASTAGTAGGMEAWPQFQGSRSAESAVNGLILLVFIAAFLQFVAGIAVYNSKKAGFMIALIFAAFGIFIGGQTSVAIVVIGLYAILRLWGNVGPKSGLGPAATAMSKHCCNRRKLPS